jgi:hypothetical protein
LRQATSLKEAKIAGELQFTAVFQVAQTYTSTPLTIRAWHFRVQIVLAATDYLE